MSEQQWGAPSRSGGGGGSVRRARERMEAGLPPEVPQQTQQRPPQQKPYEQPRTAPSPQSQIPRLKPRMPQGLAQTRNGQGPIGVAISKPTQVPQWPLAGTIETVPEPKTQYQPPTGRGNAPQRPPRPSHVPSMLDASRLQDHTPTFQYKAQQDQSPERVQPRYQEDEDDYVMSPMTQSSRPSTISSVGTIPDFPVPMLPPPPVAGGPRRSANLGPPPTSRRGASSYYSQASFVSPIPEESPRSQPSHESYASSAAIPSSWGEDSPGYDYDDKYDDRGFLTHDVIEEGRESRESNDNDDTGLIRSASLGKRAKPSMITTKSSDRMETQKNAAAPQQKSKLERMGVAEGAAAGAATWAAMNVASQKPNNDAGQRGPVWPMAANSDSPLASGTGLIDKSSSSSETGVPVARAVTTNDRAPAQAINNRSDAQTKEMLGAYAAASSLQPGGPTPTRTPSPGFSRLSAIRRPPRLDIDAVRDAEARGSLTSLPDLIRRATRLAAMMDRGKRPASRLALDDFPSESDSSRDKEMGISSDEKRQSGLSGMLAAFPPPGLATPRDGGTPRRVDSWPSPSYQDPSSAGLKDSPPRKKGRRCCGLPCWGFILVLLILLIIIAAAVVVPLELLVINKPKAAAAAPVLTPLQKCQQDPATSCQNGGSSFLTSGNCACICINGFTGSTCAVASNTGCTTATLSTDYPNVTLGDSIPRLISAAQANFSIPLFSTVILARFNSANLSCLAENALVTFDGLSLRIGAANAIVVPSSVSDNPTSSTAPARRRKRDETITIPVPTVPTSLPPGIVVDTGTSPVISALPTSSSTPAPTAAAETNSSASSAAASSASASSASASSSAPSASPSSSFVITEQVLDFARVSVLFVLQQQTLDSASTAQTSFQHFFSSQSPTNAAAANISIGNANTANLIDFSIDVGNGNVGAYNTSLPSRRRWVGRHVKLL